MDYSYIREEFDIANIAKSILSIQVSLDGFSFVITSSENQNNIDYIYIKSTKSPNIKGVEDELESFKGFDLKEFYSIRIMIFEPGFTLIPDSFFDLRDMKAYLRLNHPTKSKTKNISNRILAAKAVCVFTMEESLYELLKKKYPGADFCHTSLPLCSMAINKGNDGCFIQIYGKSFELVIIKDHKLNLYNVFDFQSENDIIYFVLNAYKSTGLDPLIHPLLIAGLLQKSSDITTIAGKYIKEISFYNSGNFNIPELEEYQYSSHNFLNHKEILNCEL